MKRRGQSAAGADAEATKRVEQLEIVLRKLRGESPLSADHAELVAQQLENEPLLPRISELEAANAALAERRNTNRRQIQAEKARTVEVRTTVGNLSEALAEQRR